MYANTLRMGIALIAVGVLLACSSKPKGSPQAESDEISRLHQKRNQLANEGVLAEIAVAKSRDLQTGADKVELAARSKMVRAFEAKVSTLQKQFKEEVGPEYLEHFSQVVTSVGEKILRGTTLLEFTYREHKGEYEVYGILALDPENFRQGIVDQLTLKETAKARWLASQGYAELTREAEKFRKFRKEDNGTPVSGNRASTGKDAHEAMIAPESTSQGAPNE